MLEKYEKLRDAAGVTDYAVIKACGFNKSIFADWRAGRGVPKVERIQKIADYFHVPLSYFYDEEKETDPEALLIMEQLRSRPELKVLFRASENATKEDIEAIVRLLHYDG